MTIHNCESGRAYVKHCMFYTSTVTLADPSGVQNFRGFFVQSRLEVDDTTRVGVFAVNASNSRLSSCPVDTVNTSTMFGGVCLLWYHLSRDLLIEIPCTFNSRMG